MKTKAIFLFIAAIALSVPARADFEEDISAKAAILIHSPSGAVLYEKNADERLPMASTTKLMTALVAVENASPDMEILIRPEWTGIEGSSAYLRAGEIYSLRELLQGLLIVSGNDAAVAIACALSGSVENFVFHMNERAQELHLTNTHYVNPNGLPADAHYSSARDLAAIYAETMKHEVLCEIMGMQSVSCHNKTYVNHNKLLRDGIGVDGGKTGYTVSAGRCLVSHAERDGLSLICVTLSDPNDWRDHRSLYSWAAEHYESCTISAGEELVCLPLIGGERETIPVITAATLSLCVPCGCVPEITLHLPSFAFAPTLAGYPAGRAEVWIDEHKYGETELVWGETVARSGEALKVSGGNPIES